jgi:hypothetical protein
MINDELDIDESGTLRAADGFGVRRRVDVGALLTGTYPEGFVLLRRVAAIGGGEVICLRHRETNHYLRFIVRGGECWWEGDHERVGDPADIDRARELIAQGYGTPGRWS